MPSAGEVDLLDKPEHDHSRAVWDALYEAVASLGVGGYDTDLDESDPADDQDYATSAPMSLGQILGLLEHTLGAEIIEVPR